MFSGMNYVYEVYRAKSFSKAAKNLYISQPSLSAMIKKIEAKVGAPLFDRSTNPIRLTEYGKEYIRIAERIMDLEDEFAYCTNNLNELKSGHLSIGTTSFFASFLMPDYISAFSAAFPHVKINLYEEHSQALEQKLAAGELDMVFDNYRSEKESYRHHVILREYLLLAVPANFSSNQTATRYQLTWQDVMNNVHLDPAVSGVPLEKFAKDPFLALRQPNDTRKRMERIFQNANVRFHPILKLDQLLTIHHITGSGMGASFVSDTVIKHMPPNPGIVYYKLDDENAIRDVTISYRNSKYVTRSMSEFIRIVKENS